MIADISNILLRFFRFSWLTGPIFEKELIISSRRRRNYFIRFLYPALLMFFVSFIWVVTADFGSAASRVIKVSKMAQIGIDITATVIWFQFVVVQFLAVVMLSTSISDEIYHKTLGVLMTTPINSFQIVFGKLLSKLLQLLLFLAISMPLLSIIRAFGGVSWNYIISSLCVTLTAAIFIGSISLLFSIYNRQSHLVIARTISVCFILYGLVPLLYEILRSGILGNNNLHRLIPGLGLFFINPFMIMNSLTMNMFSASTVIVEYSWSLHCATMFGISMILLIWSSLCVRKAGMRQVTGQASLLLTRKERKIADKKRRLNAESVPDSRQIKSIKGPPIVWREIVNPLIKSSRITTFISLLLAVFIMVLVYGLCIYHDIINREDVQTVFILVYFFIALLRTSIFASTSITSEKEARTWPILLTSTLDEQEIVFGKIIGSCLRGWFYWLLLLIHMIVFIFEGVINPEVLLLFVPLIISSSLLVSAIGILFSSSMKRNLTSTLINSVVFICFTLPLCCPVIPVYLCSPLFAVVSILGNYGGFENMILPLRTTPSSFFHSLSILMFSRYSIIVFVICYVLLTYAAYKISIGHVRWKIV